MKWIWKSPLPGTNLFPHHRRWDCRRAMISALRSLKNPLYFAYFIGRAQAFNVTMFDCDDPLASAYARRIEKISRLMRDKELAS